MILHQPEKSMLRPVRPDDAASICEIYNHYVQHTPVTFEESPVSVDDMRARILKITESLPWLVCEEDGELIGYSYATRWRDRSAYRHSVEMTIYLRQESVGGGKGTELFGALLTELRSGGIHCAIAGALLPNPRSVALLEKFGLQQVAQFHEVGFKFGQWLDVGYWQLLL